MHEKLVGLPRAFVCCFKFVGLPRALFLFPWEEKGRSLVLFEEKGDN